jgi:hypothetical protein
MCRATVPGRHRRPSAGQRSCPARTMLGAATMAALTLSVLQVVHSGSGHSRDPLSPVQAAAGGRYLRAPALAPAVDALPRRSASATCRSRSVRYQPDAHAAPECLRGLVAPVTIADATRPRTAPAIPQPPASPAATETSPPATTAAPPRCAAVIPFAVPKVAPWPAAPAAIPAPPGLNLRAELTIR